MRLRLLVGLFAMVCLNAAFAQQSTAEKSQKSKPAAAQPAEARQQPAPAAAEPKPEQKTEQAHPSPAGPDSAKAEPEEHYDVTEVPPVVTHHQVTVGGKLLKYTATAGRLPIKRDDGKIEAEMFFVAYTLDGQDAGRRPLTFAFNGGPGSASVWLHMGALGPRRVVLQPDGFMPAAPYRDEDNQYSSLDKTDLVLVDAIGTGYSRAANNELSKKFWGVKGDIEAFSEFIRLFLSRYERWTSPLF